MGLWRTVIDKEPRWQCEKALILDPRSSGRLANGGLEKNGGNRHSDQADCCD
jgi:hypothetical protein